MSLDTKNPVIAAALATELLRQLSHRVQLAIDNKSNSNASNRQNDADAILRSIYNGNFQGASEKLVKFALEHGQKS